MPRVSATLFIASAFSAADNAVGKSLRWPHLIFGRSPETSRMSINPDEVIDPVAATLEVTIPADIRPGVPVALQRLAEAAAAVMAFPLSDDVEIAGVFLG
jgi:hypothetical protein